ncbi:MAG: winged helix-turn-helix domain-containing protein [Betaproteobacteria bacterium]|nr:winged helix-turn-helix domain-containing protein [Betaproteobacteria bacterium]
MSATYRFANARLLPAERLLLLEGQAANLGARAFDMLVVLVERAGRLVSKEELLDAVWGKLVVEEGNLHVHMSALRKLLGAGAIATIPGRGYRFCAPVVALDLPTEEPTTQTLAPVRTPPPPALPKLLGRDEASEELAALLHDHRLVTVVGQGGIGKTRLAQAVFATAQTRHADGGATVELAALRDGELLPGSIGAALNLPFAAATDPQQALFAALRPLRLLLFIDNAEHLESSVAALVARLLQDCPGITVLVTSQTPLKLAQECVYRLGALAVPEVDAVLESPAAALRYGAVALFCERAAAAERRFQLSADNLPAVLAIVRGLDGVALALELAAARTALLGVQGVAQRLAERLTLLRQNRKDAPERQQTLEAALDWSHDLLDPAQQAALRRLAVFAGGFTLELAQRLLGDAAAEPWVAVELLADLVDRSLVSVEGTANPRYRLLESTRSYARDKLAAAGEMPALAQRQARLMGELFETAYDDFWRLSEAEFVARYEAEIDNLRAALDWALVHEPAQAVALSGASARLWRALSLHPEALRRLHAASTHAAAATPEQAGRLWEGIAQLTGEISSLESREAARQALVLAELEDDRRAQYLALAHLAFSYRAATPEAIAALARLQALEDPAWPPALRLLGAKVAGGIASHQQDVVAARAANLMRLSLAAACGSDRDSFAALGNLADIALIAGDAMEAVRRGKELLTKLPRRHGVTRAIALGNLLLAELALDALADARGTASEFVQLARQLDYLYVTTTADGLALLAAREGRLGAAARLLAFADAAYIADHQAREPNEARARAATWALLQAGLPADDLAVALAQGAGLGPAQACALTREATSV